MLSSRARERLEPRENHRDGHRWTPGCHAWKCLQFFSLRVLPATGPTGRRRIQCSFPSPPSVRNSAGGMPRPSSSIVQLLRRWFISTVTFDAPASRAFRSKPTTTSLRVTILLDDQIWAWASAGKSVMGDVMVELLRALQSPTDSASALSSQGARHH